MYRPHLLARIILIPVTALVVIFGAWRLLDYYDDPLIFSRQRFPLDDKHVYIIIPSDLLRRHGALAYGIIKPDEGTEAAALSWRQVGSVSGNLNEYVGKKVIIKGGWYRGTPMLLQSITKDDYGLKIPQPVIRIDQIKLAE